MSWRLTGEQSQTPYCAQVSRLGGKVGAYNKQPWCSLRERDNKLGPFPSRELFEQAEKGAVSQQVAGATTQRLYASRVQFDRDI